jgi:hypothetical protein
VICAVGCGTPAENTTKAKPFKEPTAAEKQVARILGGIIGEMIHATERAKKRAKVVGEYEMKEGEYTLRIVLLENGVGEGYKNGKKNVDYLKWSISEDGELHIVDKDGDAEVYRINKDGSITLIAKIRDGKREDLPKEDQMTLKKIK